MSTFTNTTHAAAPARTKLSDAWWGEFLASRKLLSHPRVFYINHHVVGPRERRKAEAESRHKATLSEGVWKITYTYTNRDRKIRTVTTTMLLKEGRKGFAVKWICKDGKFRACWVDSELCYAVDDSGYFMHTRCGNIKVINFHYINQLTTTHTPPAEDGKVGQ